GPRAGVVAVGLALGVLELPRLAGGVGRPVTTARAIRRARPPAGQGARLADGDGRAVPGEQLAEVGDLGNQGLDVGAGRVPGVGVGDGLVFSRVEVENEAGSRGGRSQGRPGRLRWGFVGLGDRNTFQATTALTACMDSFGSKRTGAPGGPEARR